jgi:hypothetical protein
MRAIRSTGTEEHFLVFVQIKRRRRRLINSGTHGTYFELGTYEDVKMRSDFRFSLFRDARAPDEETRLTPIGTSTDVVEGYLLPVRYIHTYIRTYEYVKMRSDFKIFLKILIVSRRGGQTRARLTPIVDVPVMS